MPFHSALRSQGGHRAASGAPVASSRSVPRSAALQAAALNPPSSLAALVVALMVALSTATMTIARPAHAAAPEYEPEERASALARPGLVQVDIRWSALVLSEEIVQPLPVEVYLRCSGFFVNTSGRVVTAARCLDPAGARPFLLDRAVDIFAAVDVDGRAPAERAALRSRLQASAQLEGDRTQAPGGDLALSLQWDQATARSTSPTPSAPARLLDAVVVAPVTPDVAVLQAALAATGPQSGDRPVVELASTDDLGRGDPVVALGYPGGVAETDPAGGFPVDRWGAVLSGGGTRSNEPFEVSAPAGEAMKGGPVIDMQGRAVGLSGFSDNDSDDTYPVVPVIAINEALRATGTLAGGGPLDADYRSGLDHFYKGEVDAAIARLERVVNAPGRHDAAAFLARARDLKKLEEQRGTGLPVLLAVVAIVVIGAVVLTFRTRTRARRQQPLHSSSRGNPEDIPL